MIMLKVKCVSARKFMIRQIEVGKFYYIDEDSKWKDIDGNEYVMVYPDSSKEHTIGMLLLSHFRM